MHMENISLIEVTHISKHGVWLLVRENELFMPYEDFPWFKQACIEHIPHVEEPAPGHLYWPDLDIDLCVASIEHPDQFHLTAR